MASFEWLSKLGTGLGWTGMSGSDVVDKFTGVGSVVGNGLGLASAFTEDDEKSGQLGMAGGAISAVTGLVDLGNGIASAVDIGTGIDKHNLSEDEREARRGKKWSTGFGMTNSALGTLGGIAGFISGYETKNGRKDGDLAKWAGVASGTLGALGGIAGIGKGIADLFSAHKEMKEKRKELEVKNSDEFKNAKTDKAKENVLVKIPAYKATKDAIAKLEAEKVKLDKSKDAEKIEKIEKEIAKLSKKKDEIEKRGATEVQKEIDDIRAGRGQAVNGILGSIGSGIGDLIGAFGSGYGNETVQKVGAGIGNISGILSSSAGFLGLDGLVGRHVHGKG